MSSRLPRRTPLPLRILLVEDDEGEYLLVRDLLKRFPGRAVALDWVTASTEALRTFKQGGAHDLYLIDYKLLDHTGLDVLKDLRSHGCRAPLLMLTTLSDDSVDRQAMRAGAADYLIKSEMTRPLLHRAIRHALERAELCKALRESEERYRSLARSFPSGCLLVLDHEGCIQLAEGTVMRELFGLAPGEGASLRGKHLRDVFPPALSDLLIRETGRALGGKQSTTEHEHLGRRWLLSSAPQQRFDAPSQAVVMIKDITELRESTTSPAAMTRLLELLAAMAGRGDLQGELLDAVRAISQAPSPTP